MCMFHVCLRVWLMCDIVYVDGSVYVYVYDYVSVSNNVYVYVLCALLFM